MWNGERCEPEETPVIETYDDHRKAMAFAPDVDKRQHLGYDHTHIILTFFIGKIINTHINTFYYALEDYVARTVVGCVSRKSY